MKIEKAPYHFKSIEICRNCLGTGYAKDENGNQTGLTCGVCSGKGRVIVTRVIKVTIEAVDNENLQTFNN
ncbi:MAG: hypothetical protein ACOXZ9_03385 [Bacteroidales bacterium]|jgi:DnaJ-class molecular chaperone